MNWTAWYIIGSDLIGRPCRIARVYVPSDRVTNAEALRYIRHSHPLYMVTEAIER